MRQFYCSAYVNMLKILSLKLCDVWQNILPPNQPFSSRHSQPNHPHIGMDISKKTLQNQAIILRLTPNARTEYLEKT